MKKILFTFISILSLSIFAQDNIPVPNFTTSSSNIPTNTSIDFINLTTNMNQVDSLKWIFETSPGVNEISNEISNEINPTGITYPEVGDFNVQLIIYSSFGTHDTVILGYIHVFDLSNLNPITANFEAVTVRLITQGESVQFEDLSEGDITAWSYEFSRGMGLLTALSSNEANPTVEFPIAGIYTVRLIVSNPEYADTLEKISYIIVSTTPWPGSSGYCDSIDNIRFYENPLTFMKAEYPSWGYFPGHYVKKEEATSTEKELKRYAEKFETFSSPYIIPDNISGILLPVVKAYSGDDDAYLRIQFWDADEFGRPNNLISGTTSNKVFINELQPGIYNYIELDEPIEVDSIFFVGFKLDYKTSNSPQDTFVIYMAPERNNAEDNTIFVSTQSSEGIWSTPSEFLETINLYSSMGIQILGCVVNVPEIKELEATIKVYPNPASTVLNIDFGEINIDEINIEMYDIVGKKIHADINQNQSKHCKIDLNNCENGFYLVNITVNGFQITKKILIQK